MPTAPAGIGDIIARQMQQKLSESGVTIVVENRPGAAGVIGTNEVAKAPADGYTFLVGNHAVLSMLPHLQKIPYDPFKSFTPVFLAVTVPNILVVHPSVPAKDVKELIAYAKANPGKLTYASQGVGASGHIAGELFKLHAGVDITHVPYKGAAPAAQDLAAGHVSMMFDVVSLALGPIHAGRVRPLAVATKQRVNVLPDVPTMTEQGSPVEVGAWFGFLAPAGTPPAAIAWLNREANKVFSTAGRQRPLRQAGRRGAAPVHRCVRQIHAGRVRPLRRRDPQGRNQAGIDAAHRDNHAGRCARCSSACCWPRRLRLRRTARTIPPADQDAGAGGARRHRRHPAAHLRRRSSPRAATHHVVENRTGGRRRGRDRTTSPRRRRTATAAGGQSGPALAIRPQLTKVPYDPVKDLAPIVLLVSVPNILVVHPSVPAQVAAGADRLRQGESRQADLFLARHRRLRPHRRANSSSSPPASTSPTCRIAAPRPPRRTLAAGHVSMMFDVVSLALGPIQSGTVRAIGVASKQRVGVLPDVPTLGEQGFPGRDRRMVRAAGAGGHASAGDRLAQPRGQQRVHRSRIRARSSSPRAPPCRSARPRTSPEHIADNTARFGEVIRRAGIKVE